MAGRKQVIGISTKERRLVAALRGALRRSSHPRRNVIFCSELDCFQGVADLVVGIKNGYDLLPKTNPRKQYEGFSFSTAKVLAALQGRKFHSVSDTSRITGLSEDTVRKQLNTLRSLGVVGVHRKGFVKTIRVVRPLFREIAAFEVKVKDWKSGLHQARNYKSFAHRVSLALPLRRAVALKSQAKIFRRFGVGLVGIGKAGKLVWILKPPKLKPISPARNFLASIRLLAEES